MIAQRAFTVFPPGRLTANYFLITNINTMTNPYQAPADPTPLARQPNSQAEIKTVISGQKLLIYSILGYLCSMPIIVGANFFLEGTAENPIVTPLYSFVLVLGMLVIFAAAVCACIGIYRMGGVLYPGTTRYIYAIGVLIPAPLIGLIVMFVANAKATGYLRAHGIEVGFLGAKR